VIYRILCLVTCSRISTGLGVLVVSLLFRRLCDYIVSRVTSPGVTCIRNVSNPVVAYVYNPDPDMGVCHE
jgi:hypothetical protein